MSYLERVAEANRHDLSGYVPWEVAGQRVGWVRRDRLPELAELAPFLAVDERAVRTPRDLDTFERRSRAMAEVVDALRARGQVRAWRGEKYAVKIGWRAPALLELERAAVPWFGVRAFGFHLNGYVRRGDEVLMWVARRARDKATYPGQLDNTVAGGQPIDLSLRDNVAKECAEEAGIPAALAARARPVGAVTYCLENDGGLKPDCMFCFDLELPGDFVPRCTDGEVEEFSLWPIAAVAARVRDTRDFKFNSGLVIVDFLVRHGLLEPDVTDYVDLVRGLRALT